MTNVTLSNIWGFDYVAERMVHTRVYQIGDIISAFIDVWPAKGTIQCDLHGEIMHLGCAIADDLEKCIITSPLTFDARIMDYLRYLFPSGVCLSGRHVIDQTSTVTMAKEDTSLYNHIDTEYDQRVKFTNESWYWSCKIDDVSVISDDVIRVLQTQLAVANQPPIFGSCEFIIRTHYFQLKEQVRNLQSQISSPVFRIRSQMPPLENHPAVSQVIPERHQRDHIPDDCQSVISSHLECPICMDMLKFPIGMQCGHVFCFSCLQRHFQSRRDCPMCRHPVVHVSCAYVLHDIIIELRKSRGESTSVMEHWPDVSLL